MATIKVILRESSNAGGEGSLYFRIIHRRKMRQVSTGHRLMCIEWDSEAEGVVLAGNGSRADYLRAVDSKVKEGVNQLSQIVAALDRSGGEYTVDDVVDRFLATDTIVGFMSFARKHIAVLKQMGKVRISEHYTTAINSFMRFNGVEDIPFEKFGGSLMVRYECHLKEQGLCPNSTSYYMRNLRAIYNQAVDQGLIDQHYPFKHVYTGIAKTVKRAVTLDIIKALRRLDLRSDPIAELARDLFLFSFYTRGMAIIDVAFLKKSNLRNGVLIYRRQKTRQQLTIKWERQMQEIVSRQGRRDSDFMFPMIDSGKPDYRKQYLNSYNKLSKRLRKLGESLGLAEPLTFHRSRHSWASIARENNVPLSVICEGMGHDSEKTTRIYLATLDTSVVDRANSDIMSLLDK